MEAAYGRTTPSRQSIRVAGAWLSLVALAAVCVVILGSRQSTVRVSDAEDNLETFSILTTSNSSVSSRSNAFNSSSVQSMHQRELEIIAKLKQEAATNQGQPGTKAMAKETKKLLAMLGSAESHADGPQAKEKVQNSLKTQKEIKNDVPESAEEPAEWQHQESRATFQGKNMELALNSQQSRHQCWLPSIPSLSQQAGCAEFKRLGGTCPLADLYTHHTDISTVLSVRTVIPGRSFAVQAHRAGESSTSLGVISGGLFERGGGIAWADTPHVFATCTPDYSSFWSFLGFSPSHTRYRVVDCGGREQFRVRIEPEAKDVLQCSEAMVKGPEPWTESKERQQARTVAIVQDHHGQQLWSIVSDSETACQP
eukprot:3937880-Rhodomonas_salina.1